MSIYFTYYSTKMSEKLHNKNSKEKIPNNVEFKEFNKAYLTETAPESARKYFNKGEMEKLKELGKDCGERINTMNTEKFSEEELKKASVPFILLIGTNDPELNTMYKSYITKIVPNLAENYFRKGEMEDLRNLLNIVEEITKTVELTEDEVRISKRKIEILLEE